MENKEFLIAKIDVGDSNPHTAIRKFWKRHFPESYAYHLDEEDMVFEFYEYRQTFSMYFKERHVSTRPDLLGTWNIYIIVRPKYR